jgi:hypothetical protein
MYGVIVIVGTQKTTISVFGNTKIVSSVNPGRIQIK